MKYIDPLPPDHVPERDFLPVDFGTRMEIRAEEYITGDGVNLGLICYQVCTDPDGTTYTPWDAGDPDE